MFIPWLEKRWNSRTYEVCTCSRKRKNEWKLKSKTRTTRNGVDKTQESVAPCKSESTSCSCWGLSPHLFCSTCSCSQPSCHCINIMLLKHILCSKSKAKGWQIIIFLVIGTRHTHTQEDRPSHCNITLLKHIYTMLKTQNKGMAKYRFSCKRHKTHARTRRPGGNEREGSGRSCQRWMGPGRRLLPFSFVGTYSGGESVPNDER